MSNHTPAPWVVVTDHDPAISDYRWEIEVEGGMDVVCAMEMSGDLMPGDVERTDADFALIAACLDLLAACEALANAKDLLGFFGAQLHAREAIRKAQGEA
jgi:hypothetical protein